MLTRTVGGPVNQMLILPCKGRIRQLHKTRAVKFPCTRFPCDFGDVTTDRGWAESVRQICASFPPLKIFVFFRHNMYNEQILYLNKSRWDDFYLGIVLKGLYEIKIIYRRNFQNFNYNKIIPS